MNRVHRSRTTLGSAFWLLFLAGCLGPGIAAGAATPGEIRGRVVDEEGGAAPDVLVMLSGTPWGALTDANGRFLIRAIPPGTYRARALKLGFASVESPEITLAPGAICDLQLTFRERRPVELPEVRVRDGERWRPLEKRPETRERVDRDDLDGTPIDSPLEALALKSGIIAHQGALHIRGSRAGDAKVEIDGIAVIDPLGGSLVDVASSALETAEAVVGGFDAEYGNAQAGVIVITTREGGPVFGGEVKFETDDFGAPDKTYTNFDRVELGMGGPTGVPHLTWFVSGQGTFEDTYLRTAERRPRHTILDMIRIGPRQRNDGKLQAKLAWRPRAATGFTFEALTNLSGQDIYSHLFSRSGFVETRLDTLRTTGQIVTRYGRFAAEPLDSTFVPYNAAAHTPDERRSFSQLKLVWNEVLSARTFTSLRLSRHLFTFDSRVGARDPWEYVARFPDQWRDQINGTTSPFFATNGDFPAFSERRTVTWTARGDITHKAGKHRVKAGVEGVYNDLRTLRIEFPTALSVDGRIGSVRSQFRYFNTEASCYLQDQWEHEGMVLNAGARLDVFSVGDQLDDSEVQDRWRRQLSPRVGMAYPVTDRDVFAFHYGLFSQTPDRGAIFENRTGTTGIQGNPDLESEATVAYQASLQHMFSDDVFGQFSVYFKDIFGLLSTEQSDGGDRGTQVTRWVNGDYASARGFDLSIRRRFTHGFSGELAYGYATATGVASDPSRQAAANLLYLPISEQPLDWDQRHTVSAQARLSRPEEWSMNVVWTWGSGFPYTPRARNQRRLAPGTINSARLPSTSTLNVQAEKHYVVWGQDMKVYLRGNNLLDATNLFALSPANWPPPPGYNPDDYAIYYSETGHAGGAYLGDDADGDGAGEWVAVNDPRVFQPGRVLRMGVGLRF